MADQPKLLLVADTYYPKVDGTLKFIEEFMKRAQDSFEISLLVPDYGVKKGRNVTYIEPSKIIKMSDYPSIKFSFKNFSLIKKAVKEADIVFVQGPALISYLSIHYAHKYHKKTVFYLHTLSWELLEKFLPRIISKIFSRIIKKISISFYNDCQGIFVPYYDLKDYLIKEGVKTEIVTARLGVDIDLFHPPQDKQLSKKKIKIGPEKKVIGYVGRISKEKNAHLLLEGFKKLEKQKNYFLLMVGDGPESQTKEFKENPNCKVTGFVNNVQDYLKAMDIFVMPSLTETTSLATLEAMASGLPVIATKVGFIKHYLVKDHNGLFFPRNSATMLSVKVNQLLQNKELRAKLGQNARKTVAYAFSWERSINRIKKLLLNTHLK
ncbi:MAG: glycosyltransferase [Nanoarchaeota archaeon]